jgi:hypothetical protein
LKKFAKLNPVEFFTPSADLEERKSKESMGYSLTGIILGLVMKCTRVNNSKTCGLFTQDWPEWISVKKAFHLDLDWV